MNISKLKQWFCARPVWLQKAIEIYFDKGKWNEDDLNRLYTDCLSEAEREQNQSNQTGFEGSIDSKNSFFQNQNRQSGHIKKSSLLNNIPLENLLNYNNTDNRIKLKSISDIKGINALSPKTPLDFGDTNLSIIYGLNGSGKSGYARILKHICGAKSRSTIFPDIHKKSESEQECVIKYQKDNEPKSIKWKVSNPSINDLSSVSVFDASCGQVYVENENEITYEPLILSFFSNLVKICEKISSKIDNEKAKKSSEKPKYPEELKNTKEAKWYDNLSIETTETEINSYCSWTTENQTELQELQKRLSQTDPAKSAEKMRKQNKNLQELIDSTHSLLDSFSDEKCGKINDLKITLVKNKEIAKTVADQLFKQSSLNGIGSETWKQLWKYAKDYSEQEAYKGQSFPVISDDALCVLCHQKLDENAKERLISFKDFIQGKAQKAVENTKKSLECTIKALPNILSQKEIETKIDASGMQSANDKELKNFFLALEKKKNQLVAPEHHPEHCSLPLFENWKTEAKKVIVNNEQKAKSYDEDAEENNRNTLLLKKTELKMKQWLYDQRTLIKEEIKRLNNIALLESAKKLTNTASLSKKKSELSEELITKDFIKRFNNELEKLEAKDIKVELSRSRTEKGKALHQVHLKGIKLQSSVRTKDILSEGESRIVALSAFLADVKGEQNSSPFVFDDPISSLDQDYEEVVAKHLVELSQERQVIVFTHRLSFFSLIQDCAKTKDTKPHNIGLKKEHWGIGEPGDIPFFGKKPSQALDSLIKKLSQAKKCLENNGIDQYRIFAITLCNDFRSTIENTIESVLLDGIVKRHRRSIQTLNKIKNLAKIDKLDCDFLDSLMTKYSKHLHSSTQELLVNLPDPEELQKDFKSLKDWIEQFKKKESKEFAKQIK